MTEATAPIRSSAGTNVDVLIVGAGFSGLCMGIKLLEAGMRSFLIMEKSDNVGGTWWENRYPGFGVTVRGFPNFFMLLGPNRGLGHNSVLLMIEAQVRYTMNCLWLMQRRKQRTLEVRQEIQQSFVQEIYRRMSGTVWQSGGCHSWYQDQRTGEITTLWPGSVVSYLRRTHSVSASDHELKS